MGLAVANRVDAGSRDESAPAAWFPWTFRRILALPGPPLAIGADHPDRTPAASRLPGLLAYEDRVASVPGWLLDSHSLRRVALYLLIPLGSWVGGAVIERLVNAALD